MRLPKIALALTLVLALVVAVAAAPPAEAGGSSVKIEVKGKGLVLPGLVGLGPELGPRRLGWLGRLGRLVVVSRAD